MRVSKYRNTRENSRPMSRQVVESLLMEENELEVPQEIQTMTVSTMISDLIKREWETLDIINSYLITSQEFESAELQSVLNSFVDDTYIHIGQLEGVLQGKVPEAEQIDTAKDNAEEEVETSEIVDDEEEDEFFPDDDIPTEVADEIDFSEREED